MIVKQRKLKKEDAEGMLEWMHDPNIYKYFRYDMEKQTLETALSFIENATTNIMDGGNVHYAISDEEDKYLGTISLKNFDLISKNAEYAISLRSIAQGKGIATEATQRLLKIAFQEYELERIYLNVLSDNIRAIRLYEKCGFVYEGEFRNHLFLRGEYKNLKWYGMLKGDFYNGQYYAK